MTEQLLRYTLGDTSVASDIAPMDESLDPGDLQKAYILWQTLLKHIQDILGVSSIYDLTQTSPDIMRRNYWHFLQQHHVRKAIHIGQTPFSDGEKVK